MAFLFEPIMTSPNPFLIPRRQLKNLRIVWALYLGMQLLFALFVFWMATPDTRNMSAVNWDGLKSRGSLVCFALAASGFLGALILPRWIERQGYTKDLSDPEGTQETILSNLFLAQILRLVWIEGCSLGGVLLAMNQKNPYLVLPFLAVSTLVILAHLPPSPSPSLNG
jgi:hypothetical protein